MGSRRNDSDACLADREPAKPMNHGDSADLEAGSYFSSNARHLLERERFVALVFQVCGWASLGVVAHNALKDHHGTILAALQSASELLGIDSVARDGEDVAGGVIDSQFGARRAAADWPRKCSLVL